MAASGVFALVLAPVLANEEPRRPDPIGGPGAAAG